MNTFQCATSLKHWTKHMATMESAAHEVTFNMISHGRLKGDLPSTSVLTLLCAGQRSTLRKPLRLREPRTNGCCVLRDVPKSIESRTQKKMRLEGERAESSFCSLLTGHRWELSPGCPARQLGHPTGSPVPLGLFNSSGPHSPARLASLKGEKAPHPSLTRRELIHFFTTGKAFAVSRRECRKSNEIQKGAK